MIDDSSTIPSGGALATTVSFANKFTASNTSASISAAASDAILTLSGALVAATPKTMINISGQGGAMPILAIRTKNATARVITLLVTLDGNLTTITSSSISGSDVGIVASGEISTGAILLEGYPLKWKTSCLIQIQSSLSETDFVEMIHKRFQEA